MPKSISYGHFAPGRLLMTANAANVIPKPQMLDAVRRHLSCDWGDVSDRDKADRKSTRLTPVTVQDLV